MIFVSYSHADKKWLDRFKVISRPMSRMISIQPFSDQDLKAGEWKKQLLRAMKAAEAAVLLVSPAFLASDFIMEVEVPYFIKAHEERGLMVTWALLEPCDLKWHPEITKFQAMTGGELKAFSSLTDWQWQEAMVKGCGMIDEFFKTLERPEIDPSIRNTSLPRVNSDFKLLAKPARTNVEVLVYSGGNKWWLQPRIKAGSRSTTLYIGDEKTKTGSGFKVVALTTTKPLTNQTYLNLPDFRTRSDEITVFRQ